MKYLECTCKKCKTAFHAELGDARIAPDAEQVVLDTEQTYTVVSGKPRVLLVEGETGEARFLADSLTAGGLQPDVRGTTEAPLDLAGLRAYESVVLVNVPASKMTVTQMKAIQAYVQNLGGGLVVVHASDNAFSKWPEFNRMIGIGGWRGRDENAGPLWYVKDGKTVSDPSPGKAGAHGARRPFQVKIVVPDHPITKGLPPVWMHAADELYGTLRGPGENMTILATAHSDPNNRGTGRDERPCS